MNVMARKRLGSVVTAGIMLACLLLAMPTYANSSVVLKRNGWTLKQTADQGLAYVGNGRTMVPLRFVSENLGLEVDWNAATQTAVINSVSKEIKIKIGSKNPTINGVTKTIDAAAVVKNGRTYVPVRFISEALGYGVEYSNGVVSITTTLPLPEIAPIQGTATFNNEKDFETIKKFYGNYQMAGAGLPMFVDKDG